MFEVCLKHLFLLQRFLNQNTEDSRVALKRDFGQRKVTFVCSGVIYRDI